MGLLGDTLDGFTLGTTVILALLLFTAFVPSSPPSFAQTASAVQGETSNCFPPWSPPSLNGSESGSSLNVIYSLLPTGFGSNFLLYALTGSSYDLSGYGNMTSFRVAHLSTNATSLILSGLFINSSQASTVSYSGNFSTRETAYIAVSVSSLVLTRTPTLLLGSLTGYSVTIGVHGSGGYSAQIHQSSSMSFSWSCNGPPPSAPAHRWTYPEAIGAK